MIEELHRPLKSAIKCHATERWTEVLPIILLGLRASLKEDILCTPAELVLEPLFDCQGEMFDSSKPDDDVNFVSKLKSHMQSLHLNHQNTMANVQFLSIQDCWKQHMFFFAETCYVVHFNNPMMALSKCKPAFFLNTEDLQLPQTKNETPATVESDPTASTPTQPSTRSGRKVHLPTSFVNLKEGRSDGRSPVPKVTMAVCTFALFTGNGFKRNVGVPQVNGLYGWRSCILTQLVAQSEL
ncbi:RT_RNaseH domain-containing protein [Trichonephila clavipes]|uniref:RT_RNaseH domain-containing protein n=1 Tax=Trichonephila clavipes TaxID=2585209 RepID=A0A8X6R5H5_TRICX|nr:RT_RNaseH domain-containing protein [Trichonephila clavipes]